MTAKGTFSTGAPYPAAIALAFFSLLSVVLIFPALLQHYHNRNIGATVLVAVTIIANLQNTTNAIIWSNDDMPNWYKGIGLCDIQVKLIFMLYSTFPASVSCILRALANVMDTNSNSWAQTTSQRRRNCIIDLVCCVAVPALSMPLSYITQPARYDIQGIAGCQASHDGSWLAFLFIFLPPLLWMLLCVYYSVLILIRLIRYRLSFSNILASSTTTKSRFIRLYCVCCVIILALLPLEIFVVIQNQVGNLLPYNWNATHNNPELPWNSTVLYPSYGAIYYDRIIWVIGGYLIFAFFGFGGDAMKTYRSVLLDVGMGHIFPCLRPVNQRKGSIAGTISALGSKTKLFFKRKDSTAAGTNSVTSALTDTSLSPLPKNVTFLESIREDHMDHYGYQTLMHPMHRKEKNPFSWFSSLFKQKSRQPPGRHDPPVETNNSGHHGIVATIMATPILQTSTNHGRTESKHTRDVLVMKEIRQASETAETLPVNMYEGV